MRGTSRTLVPLLLLLLAGCALGRSGTDHPDPLVRALSGFIWPLPIENAGHLNSSYGPRDRRHHDGLDLRGRGGDPIFAVADGRVVSAGWQGGYGLAVVVDHGAGVRTLYAHASSVFVQAGQQVERGDRIAAVGRTGNATGDHLHFEVRWRGYPLDPVRVLPALARR